VLIFMVKVVVVKKERNVEWVGILGCNGRGVIESCGVEISGVSIVGGIVGCIVGGSVGIFEVIERDDIVEVIERDDVGCGGLKVMDGDCGGVKVMEGERRHRCVVFVGSLIFVRRLIFSGIRIVRGIVVDIVVDFVGGVKVMDGERRHRCVVFVGSLIFVRRLIFCGVRIVRGIVVGFVG
jgi:hypothetical protein